MKQIFSVPDMSCEHCRNRISQALVDAPGVTYFDVDLEGKKVEVEGDIMEAKVVELLDDVGFDAEKIEEGAES